MRITAREHLQTFQETIGYVRSQLEAAFSQACAEHHLHLPIVSGNWVIAQPKGVIQGVDFQHTGILRKINNTAVESLLNAGQIPLLTPLAYSLTGEVFNLNTLEQAFAIASALQADKLMLFSADETLASLPQAMSLKDISHYLDAQDTETQRILQLAQSQGQQIKRIHLMAESNPNALLLELFSRDGSGTLIYTDRYHQLRPAQIEDVAGILTLIAPLEEQGILTKRSRENLELEIDNFMVVEIDQQIIGCAALYPIDEHNGELACLAVDSAYQKMLLGQELLQAIQTKALQSG